MQKSPRPRFEDLRRKALVGAGLVVLATAALPVPAAHAFRFDTGVPDLRISWDNTIKYSAALRLGTRSDKLTDPARNPSNANQDDGDRNFDQGLISNRLDLLSELDAAYKGFGVRASGAAWYDTVYNSRNDNSSAGTANARSVAHDEFTDETRDLHGRKAELLDAFAFGRFDAGPTTTTFRVGQYAMQWGESLFFGNNGIAGGMAPVDVVKLLSVPNSQFKEIIRPVPQISGQVQIGPLVSVGAYYQLRWRKTILPASGSYFSGADIFDDGGERLLAGAPLMPGGGPAAFFRGDDEEAKDRGQGGVQVRLQPGGGVDLGFYAIRYHDKAFQIYLHPSAVTPPGGGPPAVIDPAHFNPATGQIGEYSLVYPENIQAYGISASKTFGDWNIATEVSTRRNTPLVSDGQVVIPANSLFPGFPGVNSGANNSDHPAYAVGNSLHAQFSWLAGFGPNFLANESSFLGEIAWNRRLSITDNEAALDPNATRDAWGIRMVYEPTYRQVVSGLDVSVPLGLAYFPKGTSSVVGGFGPDKGGDMSIGLNFSYLDAWRFALNYTHFYGPSAGGLDATQHLTFKQTLADRDFLSFNVRRTF